MKLVACALLAWSAAMAAPPDPKAVEIARAMMQAMGGPDSWKNAHFVRFDFIAIINGKEMAKRSHLWDTRTGRYRLEDKTATGEPAVILFNTATQQGSLYENGQRIEGQAGARAVSGGYRAFINDSYWLAMPWKWLDQGVNLKYVGRKKLGTQTYDVVQLTFDGVGLTPGDRYDAYVSPQSHIMEHWDYVLQSGEKGSWDWQYVTTHGMMLAGNHSNGKGASASMGDVRVMDAVDDAFFMDPNHSLAQLRK